MPDPLDDTLARLRPLSAVVVAAVGGDADTHARVLADLRAEVAGLPLPTLHALVSAVARAARDDLADAADGLTLAACLTEAAARTGEDRDALLVALATPAEPEGAA